MKAGDRGEVQEQTADRLGNSAKHWIALFS